ncbi:MAG TPA: hypothetical protein VNA21_13380, partial [Steroidobacteraceae bacterium]|nr:hypothetical protein [Steroidobacteraceae bacterium]
DFEGYLHWLNKATGEIVARRKTDGERITNAAVTDDGRTFIQTDSGKVLAFKSQAKPSAQNAKVEEAPAPAPAAAEPEQTKPDPG